MKTLADLFVTHSDTSLLARITRLLAICMLAFAISACGSGGGNDTSDTSGNNGNSGGGGSDTNILATAELDSLSVSVSDLDQVFQSNQPDYTATVGFLATNIRITATSATTGASISVNGTPLDSTNTSQAIALNEGANPAIEVVVSASGMSSQTYTVTVTRQAAASFAQAAYNKASNAGAEDWFGYSVALSGDTLAVGAWPEGGDANSTAASTNDNAPNAGAVYVFTRSGNGWSQQAYLKAANAGESDRFGFSLALSGDTLAVGAPFERGNANSTAASPNDSAFHAGAVYVFTRSGNGWSQQAYLKAANAGAYDSFGHSVALSGDTLAVGAIGEDGDANSTATTPNNNLTSAGAVYVFTRSGSSWSQQAYLKAANADTNNDAFGYSVALSGETLAVGAYYEDGDANSTADTPNDNADGAGAVYVYERSGTSWVQQAYLKASNADVSDLFGYSVALSGDTLAVGAYLENGDATSTASNPNDNALNAGAVYVFTRSGTGWSQQAYLKGANTGAQDRFGTSVALSGDTLAVASPAEKGDVNSTADNPNDNAISAGAVYVFTRSGSDWSQQTYLKATNADAQDQFGWSIALSGDTLAVGAYQEDGDATSTAANPNDNESNAGAAYIFE